MFHLSQLERENSRDCVGQSVAAAPAVTSATAIAIYDDSGARRDALVQGRRRRCLPWLWSPPGSPVAQACPRPRCRLWWPTILRGVSRRGVRPLGDDLARGRAGTCVLGGLACGFLGRRGARLQFDIARQVVVRADGREAEGDECVAGEYNRPSDMGSVLWLGTLSHIRCQCISDQKSVTSSF